MVADPLALIQADLSLRAVALRKRLRAEHPFILIHEGYLRIRTKAGTLVTFVPNRVQRHLLGIIIEGWLAGKDLRLIILKARQQGISTVVIAALYCIAVAYRNINGLIVADIFPNSQYLFEIAKRYQERINRFIVVSPTLDTDNQRQMAWVDEEGDTRLLIDHSRNKSLGITKTYQLVDLSEISRFIRAEDIISALIPAVPINSGFPTIWINESTARGAGGLFYREWKAAEEGRSNFLPIFYPWFATEDYTLPLFPGFTLTEEEAAYKARYAGDPWGPITDGQMLWRRTRLQEYTKMYNSPELAEAMFCENFPANPREAFVTSGDMVLAGCGTIVAELIEGLKGVEPIKGTVLSVGETAVAFQKEASGPCRIYEPPIRGEEYVIGADVGEGLPDGCWSTASVRKLRDHSQVATVRCKYPLHIFEDLLWALGRYYNYALLAPEVNNHGHAVVQGLLIGRRGRGPYDNLFRTEILAKLSFQKTNKWGWQTTPATLPIMEDDYAHFIRFEGDKIREVICLDEALTYVKDPESGEHGPLSGCYSDMMIADAIAVQLLQVGGVDLPEKEGDQEDYRERDYRERDQVFTGSGY